MKSDILFTFLTRVSVILIGVVTSIFLTRLLGVEGKGEMAIFLASLAFFSVVFSFSMQSAIVYYVSKNEIDISQLFNSLILFSSIVGLLFFLLMHTTHRFSDTSIFLHSNRNGLFYEILLSICLSLTLTMNLVKGVFSAMKKFTILNVFQFVSIISGFLIYGFLFFFDGIYIDTSVELIFLVFTAIVVLNFLTTLVYFFRNHKYKINSKFLGKSQVQLLLSFAGIAYIGAIAQFLNYRIDLWFVDYFVGVKQLGIYALASNLSQMLWILPQSIAGIIMPHTSSGTDGMLDRTIIISKVVIVICIVILIVSYFIITDVVVLLYGANFAESGYIFLILMIGVIPFCMSVLYGSFLSGIKRVDITSYSAVIGVIATLVLDLFLIPKHGAIGAGIASSISYLVSTFYLVYKMSSISERRIKDLIFLNGDDLGFLKSMIKQKFRAA